jgi:ankyrin repeat protein
LTPGQENGNGGELSRFPGKQRLHRERIAQQEISVEYNHPEIVNILLENKADITIKENFGRTPLHQAAIEGYYKIAELLISAGLNINGKDNS